ncbi:hypothetical protein B0H11DRAFT_2043543 [Mycena galericulata]|nr:hypothetical protein B0H11DRAFT_2043543 [Mycena galericulata]
MSRVTYFLVWVSPPGARAFDDSATRGAGKARARQRATRHTQVIENPSVGCLDVLSKEKHEKKGSSGWIVRGRSG